MRLSQPKGYTRKTKLALETKLFLDIHRVYSSHGDERGATEVTSNTYFLRVLVVPFRHNRTSFLVQGIQRRLVVTIIHENTLDFRIRRVLDLMIGKFLSSSSHSTQSLVRSFARSVRPSASPICFSSLSGVSASHLVSESAQSISHSASRSVI